MRRKQVVVIGASDASEGLEEGRLIGRFVAENGWVLISGGRGGIMQAVSQGAAERNGIVIGILPGDDSSEANEYCSVVIPAGIGYARNIINILAADIVIAIGGKSGTLSELAYAWQYHKPVIACTFVPGWGEKLTREALDDRKGSRVLAAHSVDDVCRLLEENL